MVEKLIANKSNALREKLMVSSWVVGNNLHQIGLLSPLRVYNKRKSFHSENQIIKYDFALYFIHCHFWLANELHLKIVNWTIVFLWLIKYKIKNVKVVRSKDLQIPINLKISLKKKCIHQDYFSIAKQCDRHLTVFEKHCFDEPVGCDAKSFFKCSKTGFISSFFFLLNWLPNKT